MPIYEYRRPDGSTFEVMQSFSDESLTHDPETGVEVTRVLHAPAVHFKGSGFYNTDYGTRRRQRENAANNGNGNGDGASGGGKGSSSDNGSGASSSSESASAKDGSSAAKDSGKAEGPGGKPAEGKKAKSEPVSA